MNRRYIILRFGTRRVLLFSPDGRSATMSTQPDSNYITFDYSACEVMGSVTVEEGQPEPTPDDILAATKQFQDECNEQIAGALTSAGYRRVDGPADNVRYLGMTKNGIKYTP